MRGGSLGSGRKEGIQGYLLLSEVMKLLSRRGIRAGIG